MPRFDPITDLLERPISGRACRRTFITPWFSCSHAKNESEALGAPTEQRTNEGAFRPPRRAALRTAYFMLRLRPADRVGLEGEVVPGAVSVVDGCRPRGARRRIALHGVDRSDSRCDPVAPSEHVRCGARARRGGRLVVAVACA